MRKGRLVFLMPVRLFCALGRKRILGELRSGMSCSAVNRWFGVNESTIRIQSDVFKQKHTSDNVMSVHTIWVTKCCDQRLAGT